MMAQAADPERTPARGREFPLLVLFGRGEATLILAAAVIAGGGPISWPWLLGAWLLAEGGWPALRWLGLEAPWEGRFPPPEAPAPWPLPYLRPGSPADAALRAVRRAARGIAAGAREVPALSGALATGTVALGVGIGLVGGIGAWLTLGIGVALLLARRMAPGRGIARWAFGAFPWWLGLAGGTPSWPALLAGIPIGLAWVGWDHPAVRRIAWPLWVAWAVALGHGPGAYGLALAGLLLEEERIARSPRARWILWALALALTAWIGRAPFGPP